MNALRLLEIQLETLFEFDDRGRIASAHEPPAPRLYLGRTLEGQILKLRADVPSEVAASLEAIAAREPRIHDLSEPPLPSRALREPLGAIEREFRGPACWLPESCDDASAAELATPENVGQLAGPFEWLIAELEDASPAVVVREQGESVSVCHCARRGPRAAEAGVETIEAARGRGHARAAVAAWAAHVRAAGRLPLYSTWWENLASRAVAESLGAIAYAEDFHLT